MFCSVSAGVKSLPPEAAGFFLLPVDTPIVSSHTLDMLVNAFCTSEFGIIYPSYQGMRGHPPLISSRYSKEVLGWNKPGGMRTLLEEHEPDALNVEVADPGILLDMDTLEDYHKMLKYYGDTLLPSEEECYEIIRNAKTPLSVINHCKQVAQLSYEMGYSLTKFGCHLNLELIRTAALLHDLAKGEPDHAQVGATKLGNYPEVAEIVAEHMDISLNPDQTLSEKEIVYLADKLVLDDQIVTVRERFAGALEQHKANQVVTNMIRQRLNDAEIIQIRIEEIIQMPLYELWKSN
jgi:molybdenum cofactor cytidylyltransferase